MINFDANATYGLLPEISSQLPALLSELSNGQLLNPSSIHLGGQRARLILEEAREATRQLFAAPASVEVVFTSGATEGNNWILQSVGKGSDGVACSRFEHTSVLDTVRALEAVGVPTHFFGLSPDGSFQASAIAASLQATTTLLTCMCANNETGEIFPISELACAARTRIPGIFIHTDAVQAAGKLELNWKELAVDAAVISGHKLGALTGVGAVLLESGHQLAPLLYGGPQEGRFRAGTENILGVASLGMAARIALRDRAARKEAMQQRRAIVRAAILSASPTVRIIRDGCNSLPNTLSVHLPGVRSDDLVVAADLKGVAISAGSACASGKPLPSHVLIAAGLSEAQARECIRLSVSAEDTIESVTQAATVLAEIIRKRVR
jgi:cysteine desulfurase